MDEPKKKLNLGRFVRASAAENVATVPVAELEERVREVERRLAAAARDRWWEREWAAMTLRGVSRELVQLGESGAFVEAVLALRARIAREDQEMMAPVQARIASGEYGREALLAELKGRPRFEWDAFVERALGIAEPPRAEKAREKDMVHYLASPFEVVLQLIAELGEGDVLYDLGAGLGKVTLSTAWLSVARAKGVEMEPAYTREAEARARALRFERAEMLCADAREVDYSDGTAFYLYDPFRGAILEAVLAKIRAGAADRKIRVFSRGASTAAIELVPWLEKTRAFENGLTIFASISR